MTSNDPSYPEMLTFLVLFISPEDSFMDSGTVQQCVPGVWLGQVHTGVPFCKDLRGGSCWERPPGFWSLPPHGEEAGSCWGTCRDLGQA